MAVVVYCPNLCCPNVLTAPATHRGRVIVCAECGMRFRLPEAPAPVLQTSILGANEPCETVVEVVLAPEQPAEVVVPAPVEGLRRWATDFPVSRKSSLPAR